MKILIVTDAWHPQVNGVVTTLYELGKELQIMGHEVIFLTNHGFKTFTFPWYPEIQLAWDVWKVGPMIRDINPDTIHISTPEAPLGIAARCYCVWHDVPYTSSYHTKMPEYVKMRTGIPTFITYAFMRWVHKDSKAVLVTTPTMLRELQEHDFKSRLVVWTRGCDQNIFKPDYRTSNRTRDKVLLYVGRVCVEKNLEAFLNAHVPRTRKIIVGDGPARKKLEAEYPHIMFLGYKHGVQLARIIANADVFVFPSKTDTFGIVMIEAATCGTPVAAYPVTGPIDFIAAGKNGALDNDLSQAIEKALQIDRNTCSEYTKQNYTWKKCAQIFLSTLVPIN